MTAPPAVEVHGLSKSFGSHHVLRGVELVAHSGQVTGFLGANGAGKSTTLRILTGLVRADAGTAHIHGLPYQQLARPTSVIGAVLEPDTADPALTGIDHLGVYARLGGHDPSRIEAVVDIMGLSPFVMRRVGTWSTGMRQRLTVATALLGDPDILVLDEPTNGLDPRGIDDLMGLLRETAEQGRCVIVSSHVLHEVEPVLDAAVVLDGGTTVAAGTLAELQSRTGADSLPEIYRRLTQVAA